MSSMAFRSAIARQTRSLARSQTRAFHSPFAVLSSASTTSPLTSAPPPASQQYEKQVEQTAHPTLSPSGQRHYVVSEPDPRSTPYEVPYGAYPTSAPYQQFSSTSAPKSYPHSSASTDRAHPVTTKAAADGTLASRNPQPDAPDVAEKFSEAGVDNAWKIRI